MKLLHSSVLQMEISVSVLLLTSRESLKKEEMIAEKSSNLLTLQKENELNTPGKLTGKPGALDSASPRPNDKTISSSTGAAVFGLREVRLSGASSL